MSIAVFKGSPLEAKTPAYFVPDHVAPLIGHRTPAGELVDSVREWVENETYQFMEWSEFVEVGEHDCKFEFAGPVPPHKRDKTVGCDQPNRLRCVFCRLERQIACRSTDATKCEPCEARYRALTRTVFRLPTAAARPGTVFLLTLTAPGERAHCLTHTFQQKDKTGKAVTSPGYKCPSVEVVDYETGEITGSEFTNPDCLACPCSDNSLTTRGEIAEFNAALASRWNRFLTYLRRYSPDGLKGGRGQKASRPYSALQYAKAIEPQKRGALHVHALLRMPKAVAMVPEVQAELRAIALELGFGHQVDVQVIGEGVDAIKAARYVAKYVSKRNETGPEGIPFPEYQDEERDYWSGDYDSAPLSVAGSVHHKGVTRVRDTFRRSLKLPRAWTVSRGWGLSMGFVRAQQLAYVGSPEAGRRMMFERMWDVFAQQLEIANPYRTPLAICP